MKIHIMYCGEPPIIHKAKAVYNVVDKLTQGEIPDVAKTGILAAVPVAISYSNEIAIASKPLKELLIGAADPVCYVVFCWGFLECMLGKSESGLKRMKYATLGYIGINWIPVFMKILRGMRPAL